LAELEAALENGSRCELRACNRDPRILIGRATYGDPQFILYDSDDRIEIGRYCSIAAATRIMGGGEHDYRRASTFPFPWFYGEEAQPDVVQSRNAVHKGITRIGSDVWIGYGSSIVSGASIGHGAVIGACAVVASQVPPYSIVIGNPARCLKKRFDDNTIERLLGIHWWDWKPEYVYQYRDFLGGEPMRFLALVETFDPSELANMYETNPYDIDASFKTPAATTPFPLETRRESAVKYIARQTLPPIFYSALSRLVR
jgi:acetyltransferase-like isoleucine patch superfamily enzyme